MRGARRPTDGRGRNLARAVVAAVSLVAGFAGSAHGDVGPALGSGHGPGLGSGHGPGLGADALRPLVLATSAFDPPRTRAEALRGASLSVPRLEALALAGTRTAFGLSVLGGPHEERLIVEAPELECRGSGAASGTVRRIAWSLQRDELTREPDAVARLELVPEGLVDGPPAGAERGGLESEVPAGGVVSLVVEIGAPAGAGRCEGTLGVHLGSRRVAVPLALDVLTAEPTTLAPLLVYYRGRLGAEDGEWPEVVDLRELRRDLEVLVRHGATHVTDYGSDPRFARLAREAGFRGIVVVGWPAAARIAETERAMRIAREQLDAASLPGLERPLLWLGDEPEGPHVQVVARTAMLARSLGAIGTSSLRAGAAEVLCALVGVPQLDASQPADVLTPALERCRAEGARPWEYFQLWRESARHARWEAGFSRLASPASGQAAYAYAHAMGSPSADDDHRVKDLLAVLPREDGGVDPTVQLLGLRLGRDDLAVAAVARRTLGRERASAGDLSHARSTRALEGELARATRRWRRGRQVAWATHDKMDVAAPRAGCGPDADDLARQRQRLLRALRPLLRSPPT